MTRAQLVDLVQGIVGIAVITVGVALWWSLPVALVVLGVLILIDRIT